MLHVPVTRAVLVPCTVGLALGYAIGCSADERRGLGSACESGGQCSSGVCGDNVCLDASIDSDGDGLSNGLEARFGSSPVSADTDADGRSDGSEVDGLRATDTDGDGVPDILESALADADGDCVTDQFDAHDDARDTDISPMRDVVCRAAGVCAEQRARLGVTCATGTAACVYADVVGFADPETACDGIDENCDGHADERFADRDRDGVADCVDRDWDNDGVADDVDNCPTVANADQADRFADGIGDACAHDFALGFVTQPGRVVSSGVLTPAIDVAVVARGWPAGAPPAPVFQGTVGLAADRSGAPGVDLVGTLSVRASNGVARFDDLRVGGVAPAVRLVATSGDLGSATSDAFEVFAAPTVRVAIERLLAEARAGADLPFEVVAYDADGKVATATTGTVRLSCDDARATFQSAGTFAAASDGHLSASVVFGTSGAHTVRAELGDLSATFDVAVRAGDATRLSVVPEHAVVAAGAAMDVTVSALDVFGNVATDYARAVTLSGPEPVAGLPQSHAFGVPDAGTHTFAAVALGHAGAAVLRAEDGAMAGETVVTVVPAPAAALTVVTAPSEITAGGVFEVVIERRDGFGNLVAEADGRIDLSSDDPRMSALAASAPAGVTTFQGIGLETAGTRTLTFVDAPSGARAIWTMHVRPAVATPSVDAIEPASPGSDDTPDVLGATAGAGVEVRIFDHPDCAPPFVGSAVAGADGTFRASAAPLPDGSRTTFYAAALDTFGNLSPCSAAGVAYTYDGAAPLAPTLTATSPTSPSNSQDRPAVLGHAAEQDLVVRLFDTPTCTSAAIATSTTDGTGAIALTPLAPAPDSVPVTYYATVTDRAGNSSPCSNGIPYVFDAAPPAAPTILMTLPVSPSRSVPDPAVAGTTSEPGLTVSLHADSACATAPLAEIVAATQAFVIPAPALAPDTQVTYFTRTTDLAGNPSPCSNGITYVFDQTPPPEPVLEPDPSPTATRLVHARASVCEPGSMILWDDAALLPAADDPAFIACEGATLTATLADSDGPQRKFVHVRDAAGNFAVAVPLDFTLDRGQPRIDAFTMLETPPLGTNRPHLSLSAVSSPFADITDYCIAYGPEVAPAANDPRWRKVSEPPLGAAPGPTFEFSDVAEQWLGFSPGSYTLRAWVRNQLGTVSASRAIGPLEFDPGYPPVVIDVSATATDNPAVVATAELTVAQGANVFVRWNAASIGALGLAAAPIRIEYTTDETNFTTIAVSAQNGSNAPIAPATAPCTFGARHTGCATFAAPSSGYFRVRVVAANTLGMRGMGSASPLNTPGGVRFLAGNLERGLGAHARGALLFGSTVFEGYDYQSFVVAPDGAAYYRDTLRGILRVLPETGTTDVLLRKDATLPGPTGDGGPVQAATAQNPLKIALDYEGRLLVVDTNGIRRFDPETGLIDLLIADTSAGYDATSMNLRPVFALPNGDIYYWRGIFHEALGTTEVLTPTGFGVFGQPNQWNLQKCNYAHWQTQFDPATSEVAFHLAYAFVCDPTPADDTDAWTAVYRPVYLQPTDLDPDRDVVDLRPYYGAYDGSAAYAPPPPVNPATPWPPHPVGMDGRLYAFEPGAAYRYDRASNAWQALWGNLGTSHACADGEVVTGCRLMLTDLFVARNGQPYFLVGERIMTVDEGGRLVHLFGQSKFFGDGQDPLNARFASIMSVDVASDGTLLVNDRENGRLREVPPGGVLTTIAGNGFVSQVPNSVGVDARTEPLYYGPHAVYAPGTRDIYMTSGNVFGRLDRLVRQDLGDAPTFASWTAAVGIHGQGLPGFEISDGQAGADLTMGQASMLGFGPSARPLVYEFWYMGEAPYLHSSMLKLYDPTDSYRQSHWIGSAGFNSVGMGPDGAPAANAWLAGGSSYSVGHLLAGGAGFVVAYMGGGAANGVWLLPASDGTVKQLVAASWAPISVAYRPAHDAVEARVYFCAGDRQLYGVPEAGGAPAWLPMGVPKLSCGGAGMLVDAGGRLVTPATLEGAVGVVSLDVP